MLAREIRELIIRPALKSLDLWSESAENLIYATGLVETNYDSLKQVNGPALGFWQCEPETYKSIRIYLENRINKSLIDKVLQATGREKIPENPDFLCTDLKFAAMICRIHYWRINTSLPSANNPIELTNYYLKYYNTKMGKATFEKCIGGFEKACSS